MKNYAEMADEVLAAYIGEAMEWDIAALEELIRRADIYDISIADDYRQACEAGKSEPDDFFARASTALLTQKHAQGVKGGVIMVRQINGLDKAMKDWRWKPENRRDWIRCLMYDVKTGDIWVDWNHAGEWQEYHDESVIDLSSRMYEYNGLDFDADCINATYVERFISSGKLDKMLERERKMAERV